MAGTPLTANEVRSRITNLAIQHRNVMSETRTVKTRLVDDLGQAGLVALGIPQAEADETLAVIQDLNHLALVAIGQATQADPSDHYFNARKAVGLA